MMKKSINKMNVIVERAKNNKVVILNIDKGDMYVEDSLTFSKNIGKYNILNSRKKTVLGGVKVEFNKLDDGRVNPVFNKLTMNKQIIEAHVDTINKNKKLYKKGLDKLDDENTQITYDEANKKLIIDFITFSIYTDIKATKRNYHEVLYQLLHAYNDVLPDLNGNQKDYNLYREKLNPNDKATPNMTYPMFKTMIPYDEQKAQDYLLNQSFYVGGSGAEAVEKRKRMEAERKRLGEAYLKKQMVKLREALKDSSKIEDKEDNVNKTLNKIKTFIQSHNNKNNIVMNLRDRKYLTHDGGTNWFEASVHHRIEIEVNNNIQSNTLLRELVTIDELLMSL